LAKFIRIINRQFIHCIKCTAGFGTINTFHRIQSLYEQISSRFIFCFGNIKIIIGQINGSFTGKKLTDYFNKTTENWVQARQIINRLDKAQLIAGYAKDYYAAISYTT